MVDRLSDHVLVHNAALGDADAFEQIVARDGPEMFRYARNMLSDHGAAEEVVQDAFVAAWKGLDTFRGDAKLRTWLFSMVSHKVVDHRPPRTGSSSNAAPTPTSTPRSVQPMTIFSTPWVGCSPNCPTVNVRAGCYARWKG